MLEIPEIITSEYIINSCISEEKYIYACTSLASGQKCIIKHSDGNPEVYLSLKALHTTGIPEILDIVVDGENGFFIIEQYINGETLTQHISDNRNALSENWLNHFTTNICLILDKLHSLNPPIIHRDLKPDNIMISPRGDVFLIDFNISRFYDNKSQNGETNRDTLIMGTVKFAAPEQFGFMESDARTDIYGLGATIEYILDKTGIESYKFRQIVEKCKQFSPNERFQNVNEIMSQLYNTQNISIKPTINTSAQPDLHINVPTEHHQYQFADKNDNKSVLKDRRRFAPPGFRSGSLLKMILSLCCYITCFALSLSLKVNTSRVSIGHENICIWVNRIAMLLAFICIILFSTNYAGVQRFLLKEQNNCITPKRILLIILTDIAIFIFFVFVTAIIDYYL